ncbi:MAG: SRPBCC family protein [Ilumatobacter sp.]|nr:SRPBCC family protein [Ilumatobacter sp.]
MTSATRTRDLHVPPATVWAVLADFDALAIWAPDIDHSVLTTEQRDGVGTARRVQTGQVTLIERITAWEPDHRLAYDIEGLLPIVRAASNTWTLTPTADGTLVSLTTRVDTGGRPDKALIGAAVTRKMAEASDMMLDGLVAHLEDLS